MKNSTSLVGIITLAVTVIISFDHLTLKYPTDSSSFIGHTQLYTKDMLSGTHYRIAE
jgi:hypothetical protein